MADFLPRQLRAISRFSSERAFPNENEGNQVLSSMNSAMLITFKVIEEESVWDIDEWWSKTVPSIASATGFRNDLPKIWSPDSGR